jgi:hypothetical protein
MAEREEVAKFLAVSVMQHGVMNAKVAMVLRPDLMQHMCLCAAELYLGAGASAV